jgi:molecular chaperone HscC
MIERNTIVPISRKTTVSPVTDFQDKVIVRIYQGESRLVKDNIKLGDLTLNLKPRRRAEQQIEVRFTYDTNGILEVAASSLTDGLIERIVIEQHAGILTPAEIAERLAALEPLKRPPREADANRRLLAHAEHLHERTTGESRQTLADATRAFEAALAAEDSEKIAAAAAHLTAAISAVEQDAQ